MQSGKCKEIAKTRGLSRNYPEKSRFCRGSEQQADDETFRAGWKWIYSGCGSEQQAEAHALWTGWQMTQTGRGSEQQAEAHAFQSGRLKIQYQCFARREIVDMKEVLVRPEGL